MAETEYSKSPLWLGSLLHEQFCAYPDAIFPQLKKLVADEDNLAEASGYMVEVKGSIAEQWDVTPENLAKSWGTIADVRPGSMHHASRWLFLLRIAQCAALADRRIEARLVPNSTIAEDPHVLATETIYNLGQRAVTLLGTVLDTRFLAYPSVAQHPQNNISKDKIRELCLGPRAFAKVMNNFANFVAPGQLPILLENGPHASTKALYYMSTVAAVAGRELEISFVPFDKPFEGSSSPAV